MIPQHIQDTLDWLIKIEDFKTVYSLAHTVFRFLPPDHPSSTDFLAHALFKSKHYREAVEYSTKTLQYLPNSPDALFNAAKCMQWGAKPDEAERLLRKAIRLRSDWLDPEIDLAVAICAQGRLDEGMQLLQSILNRLPPYDKNADVVRFNLGWHEIRHGKFREGMKHLAIGRKLKIWGSVLHHYSAPKLESGVDFSGKTLLLCGEGGAGDEMINIRFGQVFKNRGARKTIWVTTKPLTSLFSRVPGIDEVTDSKNVPMSGYDYWAPCMDLVQTLDMHLHEVPNAPYLSAKPKYVQKWKNKIHNPEAFKIGIRWQGNALYEHDLMRSVPFHLLEHLCKIRGVEVYSLQRDEGSEERPKDSKVIDWGSELETWEDTTGAIENLDLVVSSCTSVPHLAAAMGKPTWILCSLNPYYIWSTPGETSPWYPSLRLFRQRRFGNWNDPFEEVYAELEKRVSEKSEPEQRRNLGKNHSTPRKWFKNPFSQTEPGVRT